MTWKFGSCSSGQLYGKNEEFVERCCLKPGEHTLMCKESSGAYWSGAFIEIQGHKYCDDFTGYNAMRKVTILGIDMNFFL